MDYCAPSGLLAIGDALQQMQAALQVISETETIGLVDSLDRVLSTSIISTINVPGHDNSAMDGYAIRTQDAGQPRRIIGQALAGHNFNDELKAGDCVRITTGAVIPAGADAVIMQEQVTVTGLEIQPSREPKSNENIRRAGEDIALGSEVFARGHRITPVDIGLLASLGCAQVQVYRRLRVALLSTGDELTPIDQPLAAGGIYDSNRYALRALLQRVQVDVIDLGLLPDQPNAIKAAFQQAMQTADVVISTGGVSVGDADYTKDVLAELGEIHFWKVAMKPGKPFAFGKLGKGWFFGLPGNPVSAVVTYHQLVLPNLRYLSGEVFSPAPSLNLTTATALKKQPGRTDYQRGVLVDGQSGNQVSSTGMQGSGILTSLAQANCFIVLERERGSVAAGETVTVLPFDKFLL